MNKAMKWDYVHSLSRLEHLDDELLEKGKDGWEAFAVSCFGSAPMVLVVYRKPTKD